MDKLLLTILNFIVFAVPIALGWAFMSYHNYSLFGVGVGLFMAIFLFFGVIYKSKA